MKRKRYTNAEKLAVAQKVVQSNRTICGVALEEGLPEATVRGWVHKIKDLEEDVRKRGDKLMCIHVDRTPTLTLGLQDYFQMALSAGTPPDQLFTNEVMATKSRDLADKLLAEYERDSTTLTESEAKTLQRHTFSNTWCSTWLQRRGFVVTRTAQDLQVPSTSSAVQPQRAVQDDMVEFRRAISHYQFEHIFCMDELWLYFQLLPRQTYLLRTSKYIHGRRSINVQNRVTLYVATNATGTRKVPLSMIGSVKRPACFGLQQEKKQCAYFHQQHACSDMTTFTGWFCEVFLRYIRSQTDDKVLLIVSSCSVHAADVSDPLDQVKVIVMPPSCSSVYKPMEQIACALVREYRYELLKQVLNNMQHYDELCTISQHMRVEARGIHEGKHVNLLDVQRILRKVWMDMTADTIVQSWTASDILNPESSDDADTEATERGKKARMSITTSDKTEGMVDDIMSSLDQLYLPTNAAGDDDLLVNVRGLLELRKNA
jgi:hypothetical protein